jgi:glycosyltransferase involved in cell wall biosynthesis
VLSKTPEDADVFHSMVPLSETVENRFHVPTVTTIHGNGKPHERFSPWAIFVSDDHAKRHGRRAYVHNGVDPAEFPTVLKTERERRGLVFLAKTSWKVKNLRGAASLARQAGVGLSIGGGQLPLRERLEAALRPGWKWWGPVAGDRKARLLGSGKAMIFPVLWDEPFGLVVIESLLSGTPVLATPRGSLPELIDSRVGRLIPWEEPVSWIERIRELESGHLRFDPECCRQLALDRFHYRKMAESYLTWYRRRLAGGRWDEQV